jgi:hypothetical protein
MDNLGSSIGLRRFVLLLVGIGIAAGGLVVSGDLFDLFKIQGIPRSPGIGYSLLDVGLGAVIVYVLIDILFLRERRAIQKQENRLWNTVEKKVRDLVMSELVAVTDGILNATNAHTVIMQQLNKSAEELKKERRDKTLEQIDLMSRDGDVLRERVKSNPYSPFEWNYGEFFAERADALGSLQVRYWSRFLSPDIVGFLIDLEQQLRKLDVHVKRARSDQEELKQMEKSAEKGMAIAIMGWDVDLVYDDLQGILGLLSSGIQRNLIEMPF